MNNNENMIIEAIINDSELLKKATCVKDYKELGKLLAEKEILPEEAVLQSSFDIIKEMIETKEVPDALLENISGGCGCDTHCEEYTC